MSVTTGIEWTDSTWNPWYGCTKVTPGCAHCYMFREQRQYGRDPNIVTRSKTRFADPLKWKDGRRIFTCSWSDFFHEAADEWRDDAWDIIRQTPRHTYQILTKRPENIRSRLPYDWGRTGWPNVWLGVSIENQRFAGRADLLTDIPSIIRFVSAEPLLGPLSLAHNGIIVLIDWMIVGGESGANARPMELSWARALRDECAQFGTMYFLKQLGGASNPRAHELAVLDGVRHIDMPRIVDPTQRDTQFTPSPQR